LIAFCSLEGELIFEHEIFGGLIGVAGKFKTFSRIKIKEKNITSKFKIQQEIRKDPANLILHLILFSTAASTIMNLLELGDDELIATFQYVDHKTKLNLMLTCKRFENVIGSYLELFGKFKLSVKPQNLVLPDRVLTLTQMRRHYGKIELLFHDLNLDTNAYNLFFQLLTKIGSKVVDLDIIYSKFCFVSLANLLKLTPNITKLYIFAVQMTPKSFSTVQIKLENLRQIEIHNSSGIEVFEKLKPNSLHEIKLFVTLCGSPGFFTQTDYNSIPRILSKQGNLVSLELTRIPIINFPESPDWTLENLQKLALNRVNIPTPQSFKNFIEFLKTLDKLTDLSLTVEKEETDKLKELFSLPNLTKVEFDFNLDNHLERMANLKIQNPGVEELTLTRVPIEIENDNKYSQFMKMFPNVRKANLYFDFLNSQSTPDLTPINSWTSLKELELNQATGYMLSQIKNLRSFKVYKIHVTADSYFHEFCQNNPQLEQLNLNCERCFSQLEVIAAHLPNLKVLMLQTISTGIYHKNGSGSR
jgi:hypothetical protein